MAQPKIRLKGFKGEWKETTIQSIATFCKGFGYSKGDLQPEGKPIILYGRLYTKYETEITNVDTFVKDNTNAFLSQGNEVIVPASGETAEEIAVASAVKQKDVVLGGDLNVIRFDLNFIEPTFAALSITYGKAHSELGKMAQGKTVAHVHNSDIAKVHISFPESLDEQRAIASYFRRLDSLISSTASKIESLKQMKQASLQNMFPQKGEKTPKVRFKGFTGEWEEKKIKDVCHINTGKSNTQDQVENGPYPFFIRSDKAVKSNRFLYDTEAVITIGDGNIGRVFHYINGKFDLHQRCYMMSQFEDYINAQYFFWYFSVHFYERAIAMSAKATVDSVRMDMIADMIILYPIELAEQQKIASYFRSLDSQISIQEQRLEKLKQMKAACLDQMFV